jgi:AraC family transcriptional regulator
MTRLGNVGKVHELGGFARVIWGDGKVLAVVHDDPEITPTDKLRYDACIAVDGGFQPEEGVGVQEIAGGQYALARHRGPYERLGETYAELMGQWLPANNREPEHAPCVEAYLNNPQQTAPEDLLTEIYVLLRLTCSQ